jgi:hypothetical protein
MALFARSGHGICLAHTGFPAGKRLGVQKPDTVREREGYNLAKKCLEVAWTLLEPPPPQPGTTKPTTNNTRKINQ